MDKYWPQNLIVEFFEVISASSTLLAVSIVIEVTKLWTSGTRASLAVRQNLGVINRLGNPCHHIRMSEFFILGGHRCSVCILTFFNQGLLIVILSNDRWPILVVLGTDPLIKLELISLHIFNNYLRRQLHFVI